MWLKRRIYNFRKFFRRIGDRKENKIRAIVYLMQEFYLKKYPSTDREETYKKAREEMSMLGIMAINITRKKLIIRLQRPGILIGRHGENLDALTKFLHDHEENRTIYIEEERILNTLLPYYYTDDDL